ncbi:MAG TPA: MFS transporter [Bacteroidota bacterium]|nr:MFS transporter [Bacteroidota bacterium]
MRKFQERRTNAFYALLSLPATAMGFALSIQISALSWLLTTQLHLDIHQVGIVWAAGPLAGIVGQVVIGLISDRVWFWGGRRRPFIVVGGILASLMLLALPNIQRIYDALGIGSLIVVATVIALTLDLAINISFNPTRSIIADVTPDGEPRTKGYTWMQTISGFFGVLAYVIGAVAGNFALISFGVVMVFLCSVVPVFFITEPRELQPTVPAEGKGESPSGRTQWGQLMRIYLAHGLSWIGVQTMFVYIIAFIKYKMPFGEGAEADVLTGQVISISFAILNTVGFLLPAPVLEPLAVRFGRVKVHMAAVAIMAIGYLGVVVGGSSPMALYFLMAVLGIGWASIVSLPFAIMTEKVEKSRMGFFMGIFNLSVVIPQLIVSLLLGVIIKEAADKSIIFVISTVTLAASAALWLVVKESSRNGGQAAAAQPSGH